MGLFSKRSKDITKNIYTTNKQALGLDEPAENAEAEKALPLPNLDAYAEGIWQRCPACASVLYGEDLTANLSVCPKCDHHFRIKASERIDLICDTGTFQETQADLVSSDPLNFPGYPQKISDIQNQSGLKSAIVTGLCEIEGSPCAIAVMDSNFMMGSMGAVVGEKFAKITELAIEKKLPLIVFAASGGARMQEGLISLMQMAKTAALIAKLDEAGLLYITVLTDPTTGGVSASFAMLGDISLAEPQAIVGFAGRRVIEQTVGQKLPDNFQRSEFSLEKGFVDAIVQRKDMKSALSRLLKLHGGATP